MTEVPTARGDVIDTGELGFTLSAEKVFGPYTTEIQRNWPDLSFGTPETVEKRFGEAVESLKNAKRVGVDTIIDRGIAGNGRNVPLLKRVALESPVNILVCTGYYTWNELPQYFNFRERWAENWAGVKEPTLEDLFVRDLEEGVMDTGVRAAIIKCAIDEKLTPDVITVLRATARAHRRTGAPITTHTGLEFGVRSGALQQRIFEEEGVDLSRVIIGHVDFTPPEIPLEEFEQLMDKGSCLGFDTLAASELIKGPVRASRIERVAELCRRGYSDRVLLSHDNCPFNDLSPPGSMVTDGFAPYTEITLDLIPKLKEAGVTDDQVEEMTVGNVRRIFETRALGSY